MQIKADDSFLKVSINQTLELYLPFLLNVDVVAISVDLRQRNNEHSVKSTETIEKPWFDVSDAKLPVQIAL